MGWHFNFASSHGSDFNYDFRFVHDGDLAKQGLLQLREIESPMRNCRASACSIKDAAGEIFHTYSDYGRGGEEVISAYMLLDVTPKGRNEGSAMDWVKRHDEYESAPARRNDAA